MSWNQPPGGETAPQVHTPPPVPPMPGAPAPGAFPPGGPTTGTPFVPLKVQTTRGGSGGALIIIGLVVLAAVIGVVLFLLAGRSDPSVSVTAAASVTVPTTASPVTVPSVDEEVGTPQTTAATASTGATGDSAVATIAPATTVAPVTTVAATTTTLAPTTTAAPVDYLTTDATPVVSATIAEFGDNVSLLEVVLYPDYAVSTLLDPANPEHVDRWILRGGVYGNSQPVDVSGELDTARLFTTGEIAWDRIPALATESLARLAIEEGTVSHIIVTSDLPFTDQIVIRVYVTSERDSGYVAWSADGMTVVNEIAS